MAFALLKLSFQILMFFRILWLTTCATDCFCYSFNTQRLSWGPSRYICIQGGGDLVTMETEEKWRFINSEIQNIDVGANEWRIGLEKKGGKWRWANNQKLTINKWQSTEPNDKGNYGICVAMAKNYPQGTQGLFKDDKCYQPYMHICEYRKGNPNCEYGYYPPRCNETNMGSTTTTTTKPTKSNGGTNSDATRPLRRLGTKTIATSKTKTTISTLNIERTLATNSVKNNQSKPFHLTLVVVFVVILLTVFICLFLVICYWKRKTGPPKQVKFKQRQQQEMGKSIDLREVKSSNAPNEVTETGAAVYADIQDGPTSSSPETSTYAEIDDYMSPASIPVPRHPDPYNPCKQNKEPVYQSVQEKDELDANIAKVYENAPNSEDGAIKHAQSPAGEEIEDGGPKIDPNEKLNVSNAVYATVDKSKKTKRMHKEGEPVYAQVNKSGKARSSPPN